MANEFLLSEYADLAALEKQTAAIIANFDRIESKAQTVGSSIKSSLTILGDTSGLQTVLTSIVTTDNATKNYSNTIKTLGDDVKALSELQKVQAAAQTIAIKQAQLDLVELKKKNQSKAKEAILCASS